MVKLKEINTPPGPLLLEGEALLPLFWKKFPLYQAYLVA
jgi:hypothetical protein